MTKPSRFPAWDQIEEYIDSGTPMLQEIAGEPRLELFLRGGAEEMGLQIPVEPDAEAIVNPLKEFHVHKIKIEDECYLQVHTKSSNLFKPFFHLVAIISDSIQYDHESPADAITKAIHEWDALLKKESLLTEQVQIGLFGELIILEKQIERGGVGVFNSWTGPLQEPHDFRMVPAELEVKTTKSNTRQHIISSLSQLVPSKDCRLYLVSVVLEPAGSGGETLPERIDKLRELLKPDINILERFNSILAGNTIGYKDKDALYYGERYRMRVPLSLIEVDEMFPRITRGMLSENLGDRVASRILNANYSIDVENMGFVEGTDEFSSIFYE